MKPLLLCLVISLSLTPLLRIAMCGTPDHPESIYGMQVDQTIRVHNLFRWTSFELTSTFPVTIREAQCHQVGVTKTTFFCGLGRDIFISDARPVWKFKAGTNTIRIHWLKRDALPGSN